MSDQVDKTSFEQQITRQCRRVVKVTVRHRQQGDPQFDSWKSQIFDFSNFDSYDIFTCSEIHIHTFGLK